MPDVTHFPSGPDLRHLEHRELNSATRSNRKCHPCRPSPTHTHREAMHIPVSIHPCWRPVPGSTAPITERPAVASQPHPIASIDQQGQCGQGAIVTLDVVRGIGGGCDASEHGEREGLAGGGRGGRQWQLCYDQCGSDLAARRSAPLRGRGEGEPGGRRAWLLWYSCRRENERPAGTATTAVAVLEGRPTARLGSAQIGWRWLTHEYGR